MAHATSEAHEEDPPQLQLLRSRLGTILAILPLGVWTVLHLWNNLAAYAGAEAWEREVTHHSNPVAQVITFVVVLLPLLLHTVWGLLRLSHSRANAVRYPFFTNVRFILQRLSALGVLLFLGAHLWLALIKPHLFEGHAERFVDLSREMRHHMPTLAVYLLGTLGVTYHLANGVATAAFGLGFVTSKKSIDRVERFAIPLFLVFLAMAWGAIYGLYRAGA
jgi:succinate dehydrogenase / fumarate reductase cytochrome b subunit